MFAKGIIEVLPNRPFHTLFDSSSHAEIHVSGHMVNCQAGGNLSNSPSFEPGRPASLANDRPKRSLVNMVSI